MSERIFNFSPGPAVLPLSVLEEAQKNLLNYKGTGMSILETSHRSKPFEEIIFGAEALMKELLNIPESLRLNWVLSKPLPLRRILFNNPSSVTIIQQYLLELHILNV